MLDEDDRLSGGLQRPDDLEHLGRFDGVHARRRLVEEEKAGLRGESPGKLDPAPVRVGKGVGPVPTAGQEAVAEGGKDDLRLGAPVFLGSEEGRGLHDRGEDLRDGTEGARLFSGAVGGVVADEDVVDDAHVGEDPAVLERPSQSQSRNPIRPHAEDAPPLEPDLPGVGTFVAAQDVEEGGLAGAVGADHAHELALLHAHGDRVEGGDSAEFSREGIDLEQVLGFLHQSIPMMPLGRNRTISTRARP